MKTTKVKLLMPLLAFMFGIVAAFATVPKPAIDNALVQGYIFQNGVCTASVHCNDKGQTSCTYGGKTVRGISSTGCLRTLYMPWAN